MGDEIWAARVEQREWGVGSGALGVVRWELGGGSPAKALALGQPMVSGGHPVGSGSQPWRSKGQPKGSAGHPTVDDQPEQSEDLSDRYMDQSDVFEG